jgi:predicted RNase H-like nuclease (RuvC/YqgF family)
MVNDVSKNQLIRMISTHKPDILAVDNMYELESSLNDLKSLIALLPQKTKIIQVTGSPSSASSLQETAVKYGIKPPSRLSPIEEAETCALLAEKGVGVEAQFLENETQILVCRNVSLGPGGSSQTRYRRKIHNSILDITRRIQSTLDDFDFDYDLFKEDSDFGLERSEFIVYAPRTKLYGIIKSRSGSYVKVSVNPIFREKIEFVPRKQGLVDVDNAHPSRKLVIGVDPGTTCGLAILSIDASPLHIDSKKGLTRGDIIRIATELGEPVIVASDVNPAPGFVAKLANTLNAVLIVPEHVPEIIEKQDAAYKYVQKYGVKLSNTHERDALAASIKAIQRFENKFRQTEARIKRLDLNISQDEVKALVIRGNSIQKAIEALIPKPKEAETVFPTALIFPPASIEQIKRLQAKINLQSEEINKIRKLNSDLNTQVQTLKKYIEVLSDKLNKVSSEEDKNIKLDQKYQVLENEISTLREKLTTAYKELEDYQKRLATIKHYRALESKGEVIFLKPIESFSKAGLERAFQLFDIKRGDILLLIDASGGGSLTAEELAKRGIKTVITQTAMSHQAEFTLNRYGIQVVSSEAVNLQMVEGYLYALASDIEKATKKTKEVEKIETEQELDDMLMEYRKERDKNNTKKA